MFQRLIVASAVVLVLVVSTLNHAQSPQAPPGKVDFATRDPADPAPELRQLPRAEGTEERPSPRSPQGRDARRDDRGHRTR